jgi:hypothetical protein
MDNIEKANVFGALRIDWSEIGATKDTMAEFINEFKKFDNSIYQQGEWKKQPFSRSFPFDFGEPFGSAQCVPMFMEEMKVLVEQLPDIRKTGFYMAGFNKLLDNWLLPIIFMGISIVPKKWAWPFVQLFLWVAKFTKPLSIN